MPKSRRGQCVLQTAALGISHRIPLQAKASRCYACDVSVLCSYSQHPADAAGPRGAIAASRLAVIHRPVRQIVGCHGNNLVPILPTRAEETRRRIGLPGGRDAFHSGGLVPVFSSSVRLETQTQQKKKKTQDLLRLPKSSTPAPTASLWGFEQDV